MIFVVVSTGHFDPLMQALAKISSRYDFLGQIGSGTFTPPFPYFRTATPPEIESYMMKAELVISHGGAGMTAMLNRMHKKNVCIPKQIRYGEANNLQVELAEKWAKLGMTTLCMDVNGIEKAILDCRRSNPTFVSFPSLGKHLKKLMEIPAVRIARAV